MTKNTFFSCTSFIKINTIRNINVIVILHLCSIYLAYLYKNSFKDSCRYIYNYHIIFSSFYKGKLSSQLNLNFMRYFNKILNFFSCFFTMIHISFFAPSFASKRISVRYLVRELSSLYPLTSLKKKYKKFLHHLMLYIHCCK